ncbi:hypothetical protein [Streptomyces sp. NBC_00344]|uniref:hypothetical protein n=1 Tax=Streptomyces sp. NBC_00344 TaxID=2975720 RepID=UPI002E1D8894
MSDMQPYGPDGDYQWGPQHPPGAPGYGYPNGAPAYGYPNPGPAYGYPQQAGLPVPAGGGAPLVSIGDITVVQDGIITPAGTLPLRGSVWNATDMSRTEERIPPVAIVLAIVFFLFCLLGLFFLLMKEKKTVGFIQVTVTSGGRHHATMVQATGPGTFHQVMGQLNYARSLSAM